MSKGTMEGEYGLVTLYLNYQLSLPTEVWLHLRGLLSTQ